mgnify:CR=1 FL=1
MLFRSGNREWAEELFQDVWLKVVNARAGYEARARFGAWLYSIAHIRLMDHYREHARASLVSYEDEAQVIDDLSTGSIDNIAHLKPRAGFDYVIDTVMNEPLTAELVDGCDIVFHLAANADVRFGLEHPDRDLEQNAIATHAVLEAMRRCGVRRIVFSSTGSIYGEPTVFPTPEDCPFPIQTSLYGASKLAAESLISEIGRAHV